MEDKSINNMLPDSLKVKILVGIILFLLGGAGGQLLSPTATLKVDNEFTENQDDAVKALQDAVGLMSKNINASITRNAAVNDLLIQHSRSISLIDSVNNSHARGFRALDERTKKLETQNEVIIDLLKKR